jgi:hypothetical protein
MAAGPGRASPSWLLPVYVVGERDGDGAIGWAGRLAARHLRLGLRASGSCPSIERPPSTGTVAPLMKLAASDNTQTTAAATSSGRPTGRSDAAGAAPPRSVRPPRALLAKERLGALSGDRAQRHGVHADTTLDPKSSKESSAGPGP